MCNEIPHFINACQKFPPSDILPHSLTQSSDISFKNIVIHHVFNFV